MLYQQTCICMKCGKQFTVWNGGVVPRMDVDIPACGECRKEKIKKIVKAILE